MWHGLERDGATIPDAHRHRSRPWRGASDPSFETDRRVAFTACRRGQSFWLAGCFGGRPCHTYWFGRHVLSHVRHVLLTLRVRPWR